jgi:hypothetical protein
VSLLVALIAVGVLATGAIGATVASRPAGSPDLAAMTLAVSDLPKGTRIEGQRYYRDPDFVAGYEREFAVRGGRLGRSRLLYLYESLDVERTPDDARFTFTLAAALLRGKQGAQFITAGLVEGGIDPSSVVVGKIRHPAIGHGAIVIPVRLKESGISFQAGFVLLRFDRVLGALALVSFPGAKVYAADTDRITRVAVTRIRAGLVPASTLAPAISGVLQPGQVLTATGGTWTGDQLTFAYQWERCDAAGAGCVALTGATAATYTVATGDLASTLHVSVTGRNRLGSVAASSTATAVVAGPPGAPTSSAAPVVSGTPQAGATLTVDTGVWAGEPTGFAYQWRRCDASGGACLDIAGATATTYLVSSADSRSTLRVLVVATNAAGSGGAISAPTASVP